MSKHLPTCGRGCEGGDRCDITWTRATFTFERRLEMLDQLAKRLRGEHRMLERDLVLTAIDDLLASVGRKQAS